MRKVPEQWSNAEACAVGASGAISWGGLMDVAGLKRGETVLVLGEYSVWVVGITSTGRVFRLGCMSGKRYTIRY